MLRTIGQRPLRVLLSRSFGSKVGGKKKATKADAKTMAAGRRLTKYEIEEAKRFTGVLLPSSKPEWERTEEELQEHMAIEHRFNIGYNKARRDAEARLQQMVRVKWEAFAHLPEDRRDEAMEPDMELAPLWRRIPTYTPPIPGYQPPGAGE